MKKIKLAPMKINLMWIFIFSLPILFYLIMFGSLEQSFKMLLITGVILIYVTLALIHHFLDRSLKVEIVIEYVLIGALALMIIQSLLF